MIIKIEKNKNCFYFYLSLAPNPSVTVQSKVYVIQTNPAGPLAVCLLIAKVCNFRQSDKHGTDRRTHLLIEMLVASKNLLIAIQRIN